HLLVTRPKPVIPRQIVLAARRRSLSCHATSATLATNPAAVPVSCNLVCCNRCRYPRHRGVRPAVVVPRCRVGGSVSRVPPLFGHAFRPHPLERITFVAQPKVFWHGEDC